MSNLRVATMRKNNFAFWGEIIALELVKFSCFLETQVACKLFRAFFALKLGRGGLHIHVIDPLEKTLLLLTAGPQSND
jgi:hypothetical protein